MKENLDDIASQCDLLALNAMIEAARVGEIAKPFAEQAAKLCNLSREIIDGGQDIGGLGGTEKALHETVSRFQFLAREQENVAALAAEISANSNAATLALQFEDVESRVVVYSKPQAIYLRELVTQIEARHGALKAGITAGQHELGSKIDSLRRRLEGLTGSQSPISACPASQNSLDPGDNEMV